MKIEIRQKEMPCLPFLLKTFDVAVSTFEGRRHEKVEGQDVYLEIKLSGQLRSFKESLTPSSLRDYGFSMEEIDKVLRQMVFGDWFSEAYYSEYDYPKHDFIEFGWRILIKAPKGLGVKDYAYGVTVNNNPIVSDDITIELKSIDHLSEEDEQYDNLFYVKNSGKTTLYPASPILDADEFLSTFGYYPHSFCQSTTNALFTSIGEPMVVSHGLGFHSMAWGLYSGLEQKYSAIRGTIPIMENYRNFTIPTFYTDKGFLPVLGNFSEDPKRIVFFQIPFPLSSLKVTPFDDVFVSSEVEIVESHLFIGVEEYQPSDKNKSSSIIKGKEKELSAQWNDLYPFPTADNNEKIKINGKQTIKLSELRAYSFVAPSLKEEGKEPFLPPIPFDGILGLTFLARLQLVDTKDELDELKKQILDAFNHLRTCQGKIPMEQPSCCEMNYMTSLMDVLEMKQDDAERIQPYLKKISQNIAYHKLGKEYFT